MKLCFEQLKCDDVFQPEFDDLASTGRNVIEFKKRAGQDGGIAVVYAPNGTGKSSFSRALDTSEKDENLRYAAKYEENTFSIQLNRNSDAFLIIKDQISRNVIPGNTTDYLIGEDIKHEYELKTKISQLFNSAFQEELPSIYKTDYKVTKIKSKLLERAKRINPSAANFLEDIINKQSHGSGINKENFIAYIRDPNNRITAEEIDDSKRNFIIGDCNKSKSLISQILTIDLDAVICDEKIEILEQNSAAIKVLTRYKSLNNCVVCDNPNFDGESLLNAKIANKKNIYEGLDKKTRELLDSVVYSVDIDDPFSIKEILNDFITTGIVDKVIELQAELNHCLNVIANQMLNSMMHVFDGTSMLVDFDEYKEILDKQPELEEEEINYIKDVISDNIGKEIRIERDEENDRNFKLMLEGLEGKSLIGASRDELKLSSGEKKFHIISI